MKHDLIITSFVSHVYETRKVFFFLEQTNQVNDVTEFTCSNVALMSLQFDEFVRFEVDVSCAAQH